MALRLRSCRDRRHLTHSAQIRPPLVHPVRYRRCNVVERAIARFKRYRAIATSTTSWPSGTNPELGDRTG
jgi:transposase